MWLPGCQEDFVEAGYKHGFWYKFFVIDRDGQIEAVPETILKFPIEPSLFNPISVFKFNPAKILIDSKLFPKSGFPDSRPF